jgi:hypothetical protein
VCPAVNGRMENNCLEILNNINTTVGLHRLDFGSSCSLLINLYDFSFSFIVVQTSLFI